MMDAEMKKAVCVRMPRIAGQVHSVEQMVDADRYCVDPMPTAGVTWVDRAGRRDFRRGQGAPQARTSWYAPRTRRRDRWKDQAWRSINASDPRRKLAAVQAALGRAAEVVSLCHGQICVSDAIRSDDERACARKVEGIIAVISQYKRICEQ